MAYPLDEAKAVLSAWPDAMALDFIEIRRALLADLIQVLETQIPRLTAEGFAGDGEGVDHDDYQTTARGTQA